MSNKITPYTLIWLPDPKTVWKSVEVLEYSENLLKYKDIDDSVKTLKLSKPPLLKNPEILIGQNDLTSLSHLHEPAVLHNLCYRFALGTIYTYCGIVLVAINPYEEIDIYNRETILAYRGGGDGLDPHIFAVAEQAFGRMERYNLDQSIIVSGESGAGKTVSAKYAMRYFATVGGSENETQIEQKVLASSPIMEAIGNAKTTRNDNSSRFGKYVELHFSQKYSITGASMRTYLLEKSRVINQSMGERNYHIFYQICEACESHSELSELFLEQSDNFNYTNKGKTLNENENFNETCEALTLLGFGLDNRRHFFKILAGILQLGNITFINSNDVASLAKDSSSLAKFVQLLQLDMDVVRKSLTTRSIKSGTETITKKLTVVEANYSRDALAKLIYSEIFNWVVRIINETLLKYCTAKNAHRFIGVLDIYGFETFETNSFEQFCINYANEKLQQQFNQHVFKLEQEEYVKEGIEWTFIDFYDNQPCIDLIESKLGILDLLDEECKLGSGSDKSWLIKLHQKCSESKHYQKPKIDSEKLFLIKHFADDVHYACIGFIEKNRDIVVLELFEAVSKNVFLSKILPLQSSSAKRKQTVGSSFRESLTLLMSSLNQTTPHYVRCIKPNDNKKAFEFDPHRAVQQLRACGVLETIRISAAGFPSRWSYTDFYQRYRMLDDVTIKKKKSDFNANSKKLIEKLIENQENYRLGKSKIFFRSGQVAYLEKLRLEKLQKAGLIMQKCVKMWAKLNVYKKVRKSCILIQNHGRGVIARLLRKHLLQTKAATTIQSHYKRYVQVNLYKQKRRSIIKLQSIARGYLIRQKIIEMKNLNEITKVQSYTRGILARRKVIKQRQRLVLAQSCIRRYLAKKRLKGLKLEARSLEHVKQTNKGLENKIISLQQRIETLNKENINYKNLRQDFDKIKADNSSLKILEKEMKLLRIQNENKNQENSLLAERISKEKGQNLDLQNQNETIKQEIRKIRKEFNNERELVQDLRDKILDLETRLNSLEPYKEKVFLLESELEIERRKYQDGVRKGFEGPIPMPRNISQKQQIRLQELEQEVIKLSNERERFLNSSDLKEEFVNEMEHLRMQIKRLEEERLGFREALVLSDDDSLLSSLKSQLKSAQELNQQLSEGHLKEELNRLSNENKILKNKLNKEELIDPYSFNIKKKNKVYQGILEYKQEDLSRILRALVIDLHPSIALSSQTKSLPAYIIFMMIRYTDHVNDEDRVRSLMQQSILNIKKVVNKKGSKNSDLLILWMSNILRLLHILKQYSGDCSFQKENSERQNEQCLKNFDLSEYRQVLSDHSVWVLQLLIKYLEDQIQSLIVPAILESTCACPSEELNRLKNILEQDYNVLENYGLDSSVIHQIFKQMFYFICAGALNNLLLRRELCHWSKGMDIRFNLTAVEDWSRTKGMDESIVSSTLAPLVQASKILQMRKGDDDVGNICDNCDDLSVQQVIKLLNLYTSKDGLEKVSKKLITSVQEQLSSLRKDNTKSQLLMDTKFSYAVKFDFNPSGVKLEEIVVPESFGLGEYLKMI